MGLLDNLIAGHNANFGGQNGGLLDFLRNTQMQQNSYQPSEGFALPPAPQPQPLAQPIMVGGVQMPRVGDAAQFDPAQVNLPPNAQPTQGQMPMQVPQESPGGFGAGLQGFLRNLHTGPIGALAGGIGSAMGMQDPSRQNQNQTLRALIAKGVDPTTAQAAIGNPILMKTLIAQTYGPHTVQSLGNGYVYDPQSGKTTRAYKPDAQDPNAIHVLGRGGELYKTGPDGNPIIVHKNEAEAAILDDQTAAAMATQYLAGDRTVMQNLGRGAQGAANVVKLRNEIYKQALAAGLSGRDIVENFNEQAGALAGQRAVGTRAANISLAANEANNMIPIALAASDKLPRSQYMPWNQMVQAVQKGSSSPELASFVAATNSLVNSYVRAVSPSGVPTDSMREHAYSMLNAAQGPEAYKAVISTMKQEMQAALEAPTQVKKELRHKPEEAAPQSSKSGKTKTGISWSVE